MKKVLLAVMMSILMLNTSCLGSFSAFNNLKDWNEQATDNKFVNNVIFWALCIVPVYELFIIGDALIFNVIEFWDGTNPIAMNEGEVETQVLAYEGNNYQITASKNHFEIKILDGERKGSQLEMVYQPEDKSWNAIKENGEKVKLSSLKEGLMIVYMPDGTELSIDPHSSQEAAIAQFEIAKHEYNFSQRMLALGN